MNIAIVHSHKPHEISLAEAVAAGTRGLRWGRGGLKPHLLPLTRWKEAPELPGMDLLVYASLQKSRQPLAEIWLRSGRPMVFLDKGYSREHSRDPNDYKTEYWRWSLDSWHPKPEQLAYAAEQALEGHIDFRYTDLGWHPGPAQLVGAQNDYILVCPPTPRASSFFGLGDYQQVLRHALRDIRILRPKQKIVVRPKPAAVDHFQWTLPDPKLVSWDNPHQPLLVSAKRAELVLTWTNMVALEAWRAGVPCASLGPCATAPLTHQPSLAKALAKPPKPSIVERAKLLTGLAWSQFSWAELRSGHAWATILEHLQAWGGRTPQEHLPDPSDLQDPLDSPDTSLSWEDLGLVGEPRFPHGKDISS